MPSADKQGPDDEALSRYLLGSLPTEEAERLDELSVVDDEFALRLDAVENDLVDAYARGALSGDALGQFQEYYLSSARRREKVEFARTFLRFSERNASAVAGATTQTEIPGARQTDHASQSRTLRRWFTTPRLGLQWMFAVAALVLLFASGYLWTENELLRRQRAESHNEEITLERRAQGLQEQLSEQRSANDGMLKELQSLRESSTASHALKTIAILLSAPTRGAGQVPTVSVPLGTNQVTLRLQLEPNDFPIFYATLKDSATGQILWKATKPRAKSKGQNAIVSINLHASLLKPQNYILELTGVSSKGKEELVDSYAFKVILE